jgi:hypothetical protein
MDLFFYLTAGPVLLGICLGIPLTIALIWWLETKVVHPRTYSKSIRNPEDRRMQVPVGNPLQDYIEPTEDIEGDEMQDDEEAGVL